MSPEPMDIEVVEESETDGALDGLASNADNPIRAKSKKDMVDKILKRLGDDGCIRKLTLHGHGSEGNISTGDGKGWESCKHINGNRSEWEPELNRLKGRFCSGASITLNGCNVGAGQDGADKVSELADFFGVPVKAPTGKKLVNCYYWGLFYGYIFYEDGTKWQHATPGRKPKPIPRPSSGKKEKDKKDKEKKEKRR